MVGRKIERLEIRQLPPPVLELPFEHLDVKPRAVAPPTAGTPTNKPDLQGNPYGTP